MLKQIVTASCCAVAVWLALPFAAGLGVGSGAAFAQEEEEQQRETRRIPSMSESAYKQLSEAQEAVDEENWAGALEVLEKMLENEDRLNGNELGQVHNMLGFVHFSQENYQEAIDAYEVVLEQGENIPEGLEVQTYYTLAQLSFVAEDYQSALDYMQTWQGKAENPGADPHIFMGQVYYQMDEYPAAIEQMETGIDIARERDKEIKENWWALLNFLYFEQENWPKVLEILEILVRDFPKREYWIRLAGILAQEGRESEALWTYEAADAGDFLTEQSDVTNYAGMLMQAEVPWRAARVLEAGIEEGVVERDVDTLQSLGQAWQLAQETDEAIPVLEEASQMSDEGRIAERLAQVYLDDDQFESCVSTANSALEKGNLRSSPNMYLVRGMCHFNLDQLRDARQSFVACRNESRQEDDESRESTCQQWITYVDREVERLEQLQEQQQASR